MAETPKTKLNFVGALWMKTSASNKKYLQGNIEIDGVKHPITVWKNNFKEENPNAPDYRIALQDAPAQATSKPATSKPAASKPATKPAPAPVDESAGEDDDIPF